MAGMSEKIYDANGVQAWREDSHGLPSRPSDEHYDALTIARFCWPPSDQWRHGERDPGLAINDSDDGSVECFDPDNPYDVANAERVLVDRGYEREYGAALAAALEKELEAMNAIAYDRYTARVAMAPLDVRVRAMAATIRSLKEKR